MTYRVTVGEHIAAVVAERYPDERPGDGSPCESDFWSGPLAVALLEFRNFDALPFPDVPAIRLYTSVDPVFGAITFAGVLVGPADIEITSFDVDPDHWDRVAADPDAD